MGSNRPIQDAGGGSVSIRSRLLAAAVTGFAFVALTTSAYGGTEINPYFGWNFLTPSSPRDRCTSVLPTSEAIACSGYNNWDRTRVYKDGGGQIKVGFWDAATPWYTRTFYYNIYGDTWLSPPIVLLRTSEDLEPGPAPQYNASACGYHYGNSSYVKCEAIRFY